MAAGKTAQRDPPWPACAILWPSEGMAPGNETATQLEHEKTLYNSGCSLCVVASQWPFYFCHNVEELSRDEQARAMADLGGRISQAGSTAALI